jgi:hypothetical protein
MLDRLLGRDGPQSDGEVTTNDPEYSQLTLWTDVNPQRRV